MACILEPVLGCGGNEDRNTSTTKLDGGEVLAPLVSECCRRVANLHRRFYREQSQAVNIEEEKTAVASFYIPINNS